MKNKRLLLLVGGIVVLGVLGGGAVLYRQHALNQNAIAARDRGLEAAAAGDHVAALDGLGRFLQRYGQDSDPEALYLYAVARRNVPLPNNRHTQQAIPLLRRVVLLDPGHPQARHDLLDLYLQVGFGQETLTLAEEILAEDPGDRAALRAEAVTLARLQRFDEALEKAKALAEVAPDDIENHLLTMQLILRAPDSAERVLAYGMAQFERGPDRPELQLVRSAAHEMAGDRAAAIDWATRAAEAAPPDAAFVGLLEGYLNQLGQYDAALALLARTAPQTDAPDLLRSLARRQLEQGDGPAVLALIDANPIAEQDADLLALGALAAVQGGDRARIAAIVEELDGRTHDPAADAWAPVLQAMFLEDDTPPQRVAALCEEAIQRDERNPHFHYFLGMAYERMGESALALGAWQRTIALSPAWVDPILRSATMLAAIGRTAEGSQLALEALNRAPRNVNVAVAAAEILGTGLDALSARDQRQLLDMVSRIQEASPMEPRTLALQADLMARQGDLGGAAAAIRAALAHTPPLPDGAFVQLARVSAAHGLGLEEALYARVDDAEAAVPAVALAQAVRRLEAGDPGGGLAGLEAAAAAAGNPVDWQIARAQFLERIEAADAREAWAAIAADASANPAVLRTVLASDAAWQDLELIDRVIEDLRGETGDSGITWRENRARWLLQSDPSERAAAEASVLLSEVIQASVPRPQHFVLMANAMIRLDNEAGAIEQLERAAGLDPDATPIRLELARLYAARGDSDRAAFQLDEVMRRGAVSPAEARAVAGLLARQGQTARAIEVLVRSYPEDAGATPPDFLLAQLYRQAGDTARTEAILETLLAGDPEPGVIAFAADFFAAEGRREEADTVLGRLDAMDLPAGMREMIRAEHTRFYGDPDAAAALYRAAAEAAPGNADIWRRLLAFLARTAQVEPFAAALADAGTAAAADPWLAQLVAGADLLEDGLGRPLAQPLVVAAVESAEYRDEAIAALEIIRATPVDAGDRLVTQLRQLSDRFPRFMALRMQIARLYGAMGRHPEAATMARDTMRAFPDAVEPTRLAAEAFAAAGQWNDALDAAEEWRRRSTGTPIEADLMIAEAQTRLDRAAEALRTIRPYLEMVDDAPGSFSPIQFQHAQALVNTRQYDEAAEELAPRLADSAAWRVAWMRLATTEIADRDTAREWIERVAPLVPADAAEERLTLASAWFRLAEQHDEAAYRTEARAILEALAAQPDATGQTLLALAVVADREGNAESAAATYRLALERDADLVVAANNLAMILVTHQGDLDEALALAQGVVDRIPDNPSFLDTLAQVHAARGDYDAAIDYLNRAIALDPDNPQWQEELADIQGRI